jgi:uncharacterized protein YjbJ (UPF0337 family)
LIFRVNNDPRKPRSRFPQPHARLISVREFHAGGLEGGADAAGKLTDDKELQAEGKMDKAKGGARQALGDAKDAIKRGQEK